MLYVFSSIYKMEGWTKKERGESEMVDHASSHYAILFELVKKGTKRETSL